MGIILFLAITLILYYIHQIYKAVSYKPNFEDKLRHDLGKLIFYENDAWNGYVQHLANIEELLNMNNITYSEN